VFDAINRVFVSAILATSSVKLTFKREEGQTFVEYALIGVLIAVALAAGLTTFKNAIGSALTTIQGKL
jgi:Flp pilus assembly pilin Flp